MGNRIIYNLAVERLPESDIDHHESDLYLRVSPASAALVEAYEFKDNVTMFKDAIDGVMWYDIPFAYWPFWKEKGESANVISVLNRVEPEVGCLPRPAPGSEGGSDED